MNINRQFEFTCVYLLLAVFRCCGQGACPVPIQITTTVLPNGTIGVAYSQSVTAQFGTPPYTFSIVGGALPNGLTLNATTGVISGIPGNNAGTFSFTVQAKDSSTPTPQFALQPYTISVLCTPLSITSSPALPPADVNSAYSFQLTAQGGIAPLTWSGINFPAGEGVIASTGLITGTPTVSGLFTPQVTVKDSCPLTPQSVTQSFAQQVNTALAITTTSPLPTATVGVPYTTQLNGVGGTTPYTWSMPSGVLPAGLTLNSTTGTISGTPTNPQTTTPTIQITDALSVTSSKLFSITATCSPLAITTAAMPNGVAGQLYSFQFTSSGGFGIQSWTANGLPAGLSISPSGLVSGTPTAQGTFTVQITDTDSCPTAQSVGQTYTLTIAQAVGPMTITTGTTLPPVNVGAPYNQQLQATGGVTPYSWQVTNNTFPPGIVLNSSGIVSGIATTSGTYTPTVQVTDNATASTSAVFTLVTSCPSISITTGATLPQATQGIAYSFQFTSSGGVGNKVWTLTGGSLPAGLTLTSGGAITGTPTATGPFSPQVRVTDACLPTGSTANGTFSLSVAANSGALTITSNATLPAGTQGSNYSTTITAQGGTPPYTWTSPGASHAGKIDVLDWACMKIPDRNSFHLSGNAVKYCHIDGGVLWWIKGSGGNPWDILSYDSSFITDWGTENGDGGSQDTACQAAGYSSCFTDPFAFKMFATPITAMPRYFTLGGADTVINHPSPNNFSRTTNCGDDNQPLINLGNIVEVTHDGDYFAGGTTRAFGGSVGTQHTLERLHFWGLSTVTPPYQSGHVEVFDLVLGFGQVEWRSYHWGGSSYVLDQDSLNNNKVSGGTPVPNFGCKLPNVPGSPMTPGVVKSTGAQLNLSDTTAAFTGTPSKTGTYSWTVQVEDALGAVAFQTVSHTVACTALSTSSTSPLPGAVTGQPYSFQFTSSGGAVPVSWSGTSVPAGLTLSNTGLLSGTPTTAGTSSISVTATDSCNPTPQTSTNSFSITVTNPAPPLQINTASPLPAATEGQSYNVQMVAQGGATPYTWSNPSGTFPAGITINSSGLISGTPTATGTSTPTIRVTDAAATQVNGVFSITVACPALTITTGSTLPPGKQGVAYSFQMAGTGGLTPLSWSASGLPTGLTINSSGLISGTPSVNGTFTPSITLHDSCLPSNQTVTQPFTLQINNNLAISTTSPLPNGTVNLSYNSTMTAVGGTPPYTWTVTAGSLPTGLSLSSAGVISGTPTTAQTTTPTIKVTDSVAANISAAFSITVVSQSGADNRYCTPSGTWIGPTTDGVASLPTKCMNTALANTPSTGTVRGPDSTGTALQNDINAAACGDTITVTNGSVIQGPIVLKPKGCSNSQWITIRSVGVTNPLFPPEGTRATPCIAGIASLVGRPAYTCNNVGTNLTFQIFAPSSNSAITGPGADHYRIIGAELTRDQSPKKIIFSIVDLSGTSPLTSNIIFDRVWFHGVNATNFPQTSTTDTSTTRALYLGQSNHVAVIDSYISDIYDNGSTASNGNTDAQCVGGGAGSVQNTGWGVYKFVNNHCEGASEGLILGGSGGPKPNPTGCTLGVTCNLDVPTDIEIRRNYFFAPNYWNGNTTTINSTGWPNRKNGVEFKTGARVLIEANVFENCWYSSQPYCYVIDFAPKNQMSSATDPGSCPSCLVQDAVARYNYGYNYPGALLATYTTSFVNGCAGCGQTLGQRLVMHDNLVGDKLNRGSLTLTGFDGLELESTAGPLLGVSFTHNTFINAYRSAVLGGASTNSAGNSGINNLVFQNNITTFTPASGGSTFLPAPAGCSTTGQTFQAFLTACVTTSTVNHNVVFNTSGTSPAGWPTGNFAQSSFTGVGFTSYGTGDSGFNPNNYILLNTSPYHNAASDGTDIGANIPLIQSNIAGVRQ